MGETAGEVVKVEAASRKFNFPAEPQRLCTLVNAICASNFTGNQGDCSRLAQDSETPLGSRAGQAARGCRGSIVKSAVICPPDKRPGSVASSEKERLVRAVQLEAPAPARAWHCICR